MKDMHYACIIDRLLMSPRQGSHYAYRFLFGLETSGVPLGSLMRLPFWMPAGILETPKLFQQSRGGHRALGCYDSEEFLPSFRHFGI